MFLNGRRLFVLDCSDSECTHHNKQLITFDPAIRLLKIDEKMVFRVIELAGSKTQYLVFVFMVAEAAVSDLNCQ